MNTKNTETSHENIKRCLCPTLSENYKTLTETAVVYCYNIWTTDYVGIYYHVQCCYGYRV